MTLDWAINELAKYKKLLATSAALTATEDRQLLAVAVRLEKMVHVADLTVGMAELYFTMRRRSHTTARARTETLERLERQFHQLAGAYRLEIGDTPPPTPEENAK